MKVRVLVGLFAVLVLMRPATAAASLTTFSSFVGNVGLSTDGFGSTASSGTISASVPAGSTVLAAYLYSSFTPNFFSAASGALNGTSVVYTSLGENNVGLQAGRANVTSIVAAIVNGGPGGIYNFVVTEANSLNTDGEALVVVYSNPALATASVGILDGFSATSGDSTSINFASPLDPSAPGFFAEMRVGIGFSCCSETGAFGQRSTIRANGSLVTTVAGDKDDGLVAENGALITVGGFDDPFTPVNTVPSLAAYVADHERYNLAPFVTMGSSSISIVTTNPSNDDNVFLAAFLVAGRAGFNEPPPGGTVPEPAAMALLAIGLLGGGRRLLRRR